MQEVLANKGFFIAVMFICIFGLPALAGIIGFYWYRMRRLEVTAALKQQMLERGMSADDICKVLEAGTPRDAAEESPIAACRSGKADRLTPRVAVIRVPRG